MPGDGFSKIPDWLAERQDISAEAKIVWSILSRLQNGGIASYPSYDAIARMTGMSRRSVIRRCAELESRDLLEIHVQCGKRSETTGVRYRSNLFVAMDGQTPVRKRRKQAELRSATG